MSAFLPFTPKPKAAEPVADEIEPQPDITFFPPYLEDGPDQVSHSPEAKANFPVLGPRHIPIQGNFKQEKLVNLPTDPLWLPLRQFGNLNQHGAFWLEDEQGKILGMLHRERTPYTLGDQAPRTFYRTSLELPDSDLSPKTRESIQTHLVKDAIEQAKRHYCRLLIQPQSKEEATLLLKQGFIKLDTALERYVPKGKDNPVREHTGNWLAFDGVLDGYGANFFRRNAVNSAINFS